MVEKVESRSGEVHDENGNTQFWWNGRNYGSVLPEELIDMVLDISRNQNMEDKHGSKKLRQ